MRHAANTENTLASMFVPATVLAAVDVETCDVGFYRWDSLEAQATRSAAGASYLFKLLAESLKPAP